VEVTVLQNKYRAIGRRANGAAVAHGHMRLASVPIKGLGAGFQRFPDVLFTDKDLFTVRAEAVLLENINSILAEEHNAYFIQRAHRCLVQQIQFRFRSKVIDVFQDDNLRSFSIFFLGHEPIDRRLPLSDRLSAAIMLTSFL